MEQMWVKPNSSDTPEEINNIIATAEQAIKNNTAPTLDALNEEEQEYVKDRFPITSEDKFREDYAQHVITQGDFIEERAKLYEAGQETYEKINEVKELEAENLSEQYDDLVHQQELQAQYKDQQKALAKLKDQIEILKIQARINPRFVLSKAGLSQEETAKLVNDELAVLDQELTALMQSLPEKVNDEELAVMHDRYLAAHKAYTNRIDAWYPSNPSNN